MSKSQPVPTKTSRRPVRTNIATGEYNGCEEDIMAILNTANLSSTFTKEGQTYNVTNVSNTHKATDVDTDVTVEMSTNKQWALPEEVVRVTLLITNNTDTTIENFTITDTLSDDATFVEGSVKVGSVTHADLNPIEGMTLQVTLGGMGADVEVSYDVKVVKYPATDAFTDQSNVRFSLQGTQVSLDSNVVTTHIIDNTITLLKTASLDVVKSGDRFTYTITISNDGEVDNTNLFFTDTIPTGVTFVTGSVKINDEARDTLDPTAGFALDNLPVGQSIKVAFDVTVDQKT